LPELPQNARLLEFLRGQARPPTGRADSLGAWQLPTHPAVYQFRHIELQHRLANRATDNQKANSSAAPAAADDATA
jgi:hypothetical protein